MFYIVNIRCGVHFYTSVLRTGNFQKGGKIFSQPNMFFVIANLQYFGLIYYFIFFVTQKQGRKPSLIHSKLHSLHGKWYGKTK